MTSRARKLTRLRGGDGCAPDLTQSWPRHFVVVMFLITVAAVVFLAMIFWANSSAISPRLVFQRVDSWR
jgi:hypothetical protein